MPDEKPIPDPNGQANNIERDVLYLLRAGLIHRTSDGFIFATRAAVRHIQMVGHGHLTLDLKRRAQLPGAAQRQSRLTTALVRRDPKN